MIIIIEILKTKSTACCVKQKEEEEKVCSIFANFLLLSRKPSLYLGKLLGTPEYHKCALPLLI